MELIVIDGDRMKIMLSGEEMSSYSIDAMAIDTEDEDTRRILYDIIDRARRSAGLGGECGRMFVRVFPSGDGGCEMYVTKYAVSCLDDLVRISRALEARGYSGRSEVYISEMEEEYYLVLTDDRADTSIVCEYAEPVSFSAMPAYLSEHARLLCEREAVSSFSRLF